MKAKPLRIVGGQMRGQLVRYNGFRSTRPIRDFVRENLFNILGKRIADTIVIDPFAGTGIMVAESISRGAKEAVAIECDRHAVRQIQDNFKHLKIDDCTRVISGDAFRVLPLTLQGLSNDNEWILFLCPPYIMYETRIDDLNQMIMAAASLQSKGLVVVESERSFDVSGLCDGEWRVRQYGVTQLALAELDSISAQ